MNSPHHGSLHLKQINTVTKFFSFCLFILLGSCVSGQILEPSKWTVSSTNPSAKVGEEIEIIFKAVIEKNWYLYSNEFDCEDGPTKTSFTFIPNIVGS